MHVSEPGVCNSQPRWAPLGSDTGLRRGHRADCLSQLGGRSLLHPLPKLSTCMGRLPAPGLPRHTEPFSPSLQCIMCLVNT